MPDRIAEWLEAHKKGAMSKAELHEKLRQTFHEPLFGFLKTFRLKNNMAEDLIQDVWVSVFKSLPTFRGESQFKTWLFRIARNAAYSHRDRRFENLDAMEADPRDPRPGPKTETMAKDLQEAFLLVIHSLEPALRELVYLRYRENLTFQEITEITGIPISTVRSRLQEALKLVFRFVKTMDGK